MNRKRYRLDISHAYSTNETLSNDTKDNDLVTLTMPFILKITNFGFCCRRGICVSQTHPIYPFMSRPIVYGLCCRSRHLCFKTHQSCKFYEERFSKIILNVSVLVILWLFYWVVTFCLQITKVITENFIHNHQTEDMLYRKFQLKEVLSLPIHQELGRGKGHRPAKGGVFYTNTSRTR